jgi:sugar phosphate isomerase/epimerase
MATMANRLAVFVKPWKSLSLQELGAVLQRIGFDAVELPVRPGFPCQPETIEEDLPRAVKILGDYGVTIVNVTADLPLSDERLYAACASAEIPMNRVMFHLGDKSYWEAEKAARQQLDAALPHCEQYNVQIGIQNHVGRFVGVHDLGLHHLVRDYNARHIGIIWDAAHNALAGMEPEPALEVVESHLCMVNFKNAFWQRVNGPEASMAEWRVYWTLGRHGLASWPRVVAKLKAMEYTGPICLTAEYSDHDRVDALIAEDLAFARSLL